MIVLLVSSALTMATVTGLAARSQDPQERPVFRAAVDRVAVATSVRTRRGKPVSDLKVEDFKLIDSGQPRNINEVRTELMGVSLALLVDYSGSMGFAEKRDASRAVAIS
jgi:hypothetical protein